MIVGYMEYIGYRVISLLFAPLVLFTYRSFIIFTSFSLHPYLHTHHIHIHTKYFNILSPFLSLSPYLSLSLIFTHIHSHILYLFFIFPSFCLYHISLIYLSCLSLMSIYHLSISSLSIISIYIISIYHISIYHYHSCLILYTYPSHHPAYTHYNIYLLCLSAICLVSVCHHHIIIILSLYYHTTILSSYIFIICHHYIIIIYYYHLLSLQQLLL